MNQDFLSIESDIETISGNKIVMLKSFDYKWIAAIVLAISMFWLQDVVDPDNGAPTMAILTFGFALLLIGIIKFFSKRTFYYLDGTIMKLATFSFDADYASEVLSYCDSGEFDKLSSIPNKSHSHILLKVIYDDIMDVVYFQNFSFTDYVYKPCNSVRSLDSDKIPLLLSFLNDSHNHLVRE